jgi:dTMP kinase
VQTPGFFVTIEGIEGSGKSTQARRLTEFLRARTHREVVATREPGGTDVTQRIRSLLADPSAALDPRAELFLFLADRSHHVATVIGPALARGAIVVSDRYSDSTLAYQGYARGHDLELLRDLNAWASYGATPDLTLWIDCDVELGLARANKRAGGPGDRFEAEPLRFHEKVRRGFAEIAAAEPQRVVRIDGALDLDAVLSAMKAAVLARLPSVEAVQ